MAVNLPTTDDPAAPRRRRHRAQAASGPISWEAYLAMEATTRRQEIVDGKLIVGPAPSDDHQLTLGDLFRALDSHVSDARLGHVLMAPLDVVIRKSPRLRVRQPDLAYWSAERVGGQTRSAFKAARKNGLAPDLVVELLSPDETRRRLQSKLADYAEIGIPEVWLIGEQMEAVEVLRLTETAYERAGLYGRGDTAASIVLPGFMLDLDRLFERD